MKRFRPLYFAIRTYLPTARGYWRPTHSNEKGRTFEFRSMLVFYSAMIFETMLPKLDGLLSVCLYCGPNGDQHYAVERNIAVNALIARSPFAHARYPTFYSTGVEMCTKISTAVPGDGPALLRWFCWLCLGRCLHRYLQSKLRCDRRTWNDRYREICPVLPCRDMAISHHKLYLALLLFVVHFPFFLRCSFRVGVSVTTERGHWDGWNFPCQT